MPLVKAGTCLYLPDVGNRKTRLHVVVNDAYDDPPAFVLVSFSSTVDIDKTLILNVGDHSYIDQETFVVYPWMQPKNAAKLEAAVSADISIRYHHACSPQLLKRIQDGIFKSPYTKEGIYEFCRLALNRTDVPSWQEVNRAPPKRS
jgi:hypothetical protein